MGYNKNVIRILVHKVEETYELSHVHWSNDNYGIAHEFVFYLCAGDQPRAFQILSSALPLSSTPWLLNWQSVCVCVCERECLIVL
jgi:hypothetical protein